MPAVEAKIAMPAIRILGEWDIHDRVWRVVWCAWSATSARPGSELGKAYHSNVKRSGWPRCCEALQPSTCDLCSLQRNGRAVSNVGDSTAKNDKFLGSLRQLVTLASWAPKQSYPALASGLRSHLALMPLHLSPCDRGSCARLYRISFMKEDRDWTQSSACARANI